MPVKTFKTSVNDVKIEKLLILYLQKIIPDFLIHFHLEDGENILRLNGNREVTSLVIEVMATQGIECTPL